MPDSPSLAIKILLVEDNPGDVRLLRETLKDIGAGPFEMVPVAQLGEALQRLDREHFDVILLDLALPDSQGFDTFAQVRARAPGAPIMVLTGLDDDGLAMKTLREGAQDYLTKGRVNGPLLVRAIRYAIERHGLLTLFAQTKQEVEAREAGLRQVITANPDGILIVDQNHVTRFVNPAAETLLGRPAGELVGAPFTLAVTVGETTRIDVPRAGNTPCPIEMHIVKTEWEGEVAYLVSLHDLSQRR